MTSQAVRIGSFRISVANTSSLTAQRISSAPTSTEQGPRHPEREGAQDPRAEQGRPGQQLLQPSQRLGQERGVGAVEARVDAVGEHLHRGVGIALGHPSGGVDQDCDRVGERAGPGGDGPAQAADPGHQVGRGRADLVKQRPGAMALAGDPRGLGGGHQSTGALVLARGQPGAAFERRRRDVVRRPGPRPLGNCSQAVGGVVVRVRDGGGQMPGPAVRIVLRRLGAESGMDRPAVRGRRTAVHRRSHQRVPEPDRLPLEPDQAGVDRVDEAYGIDSETSRCRRHDRPVSARRGRCEQRQPRRR